MDTNRLIDSLQNTAFKIAVHCKDSYHKSRLAYITFKEDIWIQMRPNKKYENSNSISPIKWIACELASASLEIRNAWGITNYT
jgi:hypothetical protein